jgi:hypothetical protein
MSKCIRIENPVSGCGFTSNNRAKRFVAQGRAQWVKEGVAIRFVSTDHRHESAKKSAEQACVYDRAASTGRAQFDEIANLPVVRPGVLLGFGRRKGGSRRGSAV